MPNVVRVGDINVVGGAVLSGASTVKSEGSPIAFPNMPVAPHPPCGAPGQQAHCTAKTTGGSSTVKCEGQPVLHANDIDDCGHPRQQFSPTVKVGS